MKLSTILRHMREGAKNIIRNGWMSFASMSSMFISLFILGVFLLLALNVNAMADQIESQVQIRVYLQLNVDQAKVTELQNKIGNITEVSNVRFVSKAEGLEILRESLGKENEDLIEGYENEKNPLPDSFTVEVYDPLTIETAVAQIEAVNKADEALPIAKVKYGQGTVEKLFTITNVVRNVGFVVVIGLGITAMFLISNTIKMTIIARRREIGIMKLVGATNSFIRWPFFIEGALIGIISSVLTTVVILVAYSQFVDFTETDLALMMIKLVTFKEAAGMTALLLIGLGTLLGIWGSTISVRKYLKV
ncbi:permease-like cell division protein FtsX [Paenibacillus harenae]|uniref:Cell division protein FtsX n=1 Tax=Paenibacillus harenae TaxID=306543 RepID=A0ABT9UAB5_PAEHA|nr:permease-like cell division protein FtsX [Paenibacillus harenae]MDQ0062073.1 cell division transport system permease protein [Paenibacillus harenae]MDQ0116581.1 cell division transport system permease protein [Paenibacillus harenae]